MPGSENKVQFANGYRLEASGSQEVQIMQKTATDVSCVNNAGSPEGVIAANMGSICHDRTNGDIWKKKTGTGVTGWQNLLAGPAIDYHDTPLIVGSSASKGANYLTIASAIADAVVLGGVQNIAIQPGTYTEDLTLQPNINLVAYVGSERTPTVSIVGKLTFTQAGTCTIAGIRLTTNSDNFLAVTGSASSIVHLENCFLNCLNANGISFTSSVSSSRIYCYRCEINIGDASKTLYVSTAAGEIQFFYCYTSETTATPTTASTHTTARMIMWFSRFNFPVACTSTGQWDIRHSFFGLSNQNLTAITSAGTGAGTIEQTTIYSGTAVAVSIGAGTTLKLSDCVIQSTNTNAIDGLGTIEYNGLVFKNSSNISTTTQTIRNEGPSRTIGSTNTGNTNTLTVTNPSNTASSAANIVSTVGGGTAADATYQAVVSGVTTWTWGVDNSDSDAYVIAASATLGTTNVMKSTTAGAITFPASTVSATGGDFDVTRSNSGAAVTATVSNSSNTATSSANIVASVAGGTAADATHQAVVSGVTTWTWGVDNSDSDAFVIASGTALGTNNIMRVATTGEINYPLQTAFMAFLASNDNDVTGDGTSLNLGSVTALTEVFDQNNDFNTNGTFTAPVTGRYYLGMGLLLQQLVAGTNTPNCSINTSNRNYNNANNGNCFTGNNNYETNCLADMDAGDTATVIVRVGGGTKIVDIFGAATDPRSFFYGYLAC